MKKQLLTFIFFFSLISFSQAQYQYIPDANFRNYLMNNGYSGCMTGDSLDISCSAVVNATYMNCSNKSIADITGIQYFTHLTYLNCSYNYIQSLDGGFWHISQYVTFLDCSYNQIQFLPTFLPSQLATLACWNNQLVSLPTLPSTLTDLECDYNNLTSLPGLPSALSVLSCSGNQITVLPPLPPTLTYLKFSANDVTALDSVPLGVTYLDCASNQLDSLPTLPPQLTYLDCGFNFLTSIPSLPSMLKTLNCAGNNLDSLPPLDSSLVNVDCHQNQLSSLPVLTDSITNIDCSQNQLTSLPTLPDSLLTLNCASNYNLNVLPLLPGYLQTLNCAGDNLSSLPSLPSGLISLYCGSNGSIISFPALPSSLLNFYCTFSIQTSLPSLPSNLRNLRCNSSALTSLPILPSGLTYLDCSFNQITNIPNFSDSLYMANIRYNPISCLPQMKIINTLDWGNTNITCLPNIGRIHFSSPLIDTLPLCDPFSLCPLFWNISGKVFFDADSSCIQDTTEISLKDIPVALDSGGTQLQQMLTDNYGRYSFQTGYGTYELKIDTVNAPYHVVCPVTFFGTSTLSAADSMDTDIDFGLACNSGFDLTARSISPTSIFTVGHQQTLHLNAGEGMSFSGISCATSISGSVEAILQGLVSYISPAAGAITPTSVNGDTIIWNISDFSLVDPVHDFNIIVEVSTNATINDSVCVQLNVLPTAGDNIPSNNSLSECFPILASFDPNEKYMSPSGMVDTSQQWFTFTIFFQNTGNAPAEDIYILDTLDQNLDATTFTYLSSSHEAITQLLPGNILRFNYPGINLIDSTTDEPGSHGYVQYKVRRKENIPVNTTISNTAYIYFDFNVPVATNTVNATFVLNVGIEQPACSQLRIYPNPVDAKLSVNAKQYPITSIEVWDLLGKEIIERQFITGIKSVTIDVETLFPGVYILKVRTEKNTETKKFVKQ